MRPKGPKLPLEPNWDSLKLKKPELDTEHLNGIAELSSAYLHPEAAEFSEEDLLSNLAQLWKMSKQQPAKMSSKDAKRIEKIVMSAFSAANARILRSPDAGGGGGSHQAQEKQAANPTGRFLGRFFHKPASEVIVVSKQERDLAAAKSLISKASSISPTNKKELNKAFEAYLEAEKIYLKCGELELAGEVLDKMWQAAKDLPRNSIRSNLLALSKEYLRLARALLDNKENEKAGECVGKAAAALPYIYFENEFLDLLDSVLMRNSRAQKRIGNAYLKSGQPINAAKYFKEHSLYKRAAEAYLAAGDTKKAAECYAENRSYLKAAQLSESTGNFLDAGEYYREYLKSYGVPNKIFAIETLSMVGSMASMLFADAAGADPNGPLMWANFGAFTAGTYAFFDSGMFASKYSISKKLSDKTTLVKYTNKAMECYETHLRMLKEQNDCVGLFNAYVQLGRNSSSYLWQSGYTQKSLHAEEQHEEWRERYDELARKSFLPALKELRKNPDAFIKMLENYRHHAIHEKNINAVLEEISSFEASLGKTGDVGLVVRLLLAKANLLRDLDPGQSANYKERARQLLVEDGIQRVGTGEFAKGYERLKQAIELTLAAQKVQHCLQYGELFFKHRELPIASEFYKFASEYEQDLQLRAHYKHVRIVYSEFAGEQQDVVYAKIVPALSGYAQLERSPSLAVVFCDEVRGKIPVFEKLGEKQVQMGFDRIYSRLSAQYNEFESDLLAGR